MDVTPLVRKGQQIIQSYAGGAFKVSGVRYDGAVIVYPEETVVWPISGGFQSLVFEDFAGIITRRAALDVVLLGCGPRMAFLPPDLKAALRAGGVVVETMDTGAAARTYNVLMAEGRRVAAALLPT